MAFIVIVSALFAMIAGMTAAFAGYPVHGGVMMVCGALIGVAGLEAFT